MPNILSWTVVPWAWHCSKDALLEWLVRISSAASNKDMCLFLLGSLAGTGFSRNCWLPPWAGVRAGGQPLVRQAEVGKSEPVLCDECPVSTATGWALVPFLVCSPWPLGDLHGHRVWLSWFLAQLCSCITNRDLLGASASTYVQVSLGGSLGAPDEFAQMPCPGLISWCGQLVGVEFFPSVLLRSFPTCRAPFSYGHQCQKHVEFLK